MITSEPYVMKSTHYLLVALLVLGGASTAKAAAVKTAPVSLKIATSTAISTPKANKDPLVALMETLASSIDKVSLQIDNLQKQGADTGDAEGLIFDAKLQLHTVELSLIYGNATSTASSSDSVASSTVSVETTATTSEISLKKTPDDVRKKAVDQLKVAYVDILNSIKTLKKTIALQREIIATSDSDDAASATSTSVTAATTTSPNDTSSSSDNSSSAQ